MKREEPHKHPDSLHYSQRKRRRGLLKNWGLWGREIKIAPITAFFQAVLCITQLKESHVFISTLSAVSCVPTGQPLQRLGFVLRRSSFEKERKKNCCSFVVCVRLCVVCVRVCAQHVVLAI